MNEVKETKPRKLFIVMIIVSLCLTLLFIWVTVIPFYTRVRVYVEISRDKINDVWISKEQIPLIAKLLSPHLSFGKGRGAYDLYTIICTDKGIHDSIMFNIPTGRYFEVTEISKHYQIIVELQRNGTVVDQFSFEWESPWKG